MNTINPTPETTTVPAFPVFSPQIVALATTREARQLMDQSDHVMALAIDLGFDRIITEAAPLEWGSAHHLIESGQNTHAPHLQIFGYFLALGAMNRSGGGGELVDKLTKRLLALLLPSIVAEMDGAHAA